jgi:hypothetical protein
MLVHRDTTKKATPKEVGGFTGDAGEIPLGGPGADIKGPEFKL